MAGTPWTWAWTPLEGLVMGGARDIDPAVFHLARVAGMFIDVIDHLFNRARA